MVLKVLIIISIILQTLATVAAIRLTRLTKYNSVWILFIIALTAMSFTRYGQYVQIFVSEKQLRVPQDFFIWMGVIASLCMAVGVLYAHKLFKYISRLDRQRKLTNKRIISTVLRTEEKTRSTFSRELHDGLGPLLSSAKMSMSVLAKGEHTPEERELLGSTAAVIDEAIRSLREISNNLSPQVLNDFGLVRGINNFINKSSMLRELDLKFETNLRSERFDTDVEVIVYRVICELINNSLKHSGCRHIDISLQYEGKRLTLRYSDDGCGFNPDAVMDCGMGMSNITSRVNSLGGTVQIDSRKGEGMRAEIAVNVTGENIVNDDDKRD